MTQQEFLSFIDFVGRLRTTYRHCWSVDGRRESVAEHSHRLAFMPMLLKDEFPDINLDKVTKMCLIHDLGEAFTGDIPVFDKTAADEEREEKLLQEWVQSLPADKAREMLELYKEMDARETLEAKVYKALDGLEAVIQHNFSHTSTWEPNEYELNLTYGWERLQFSPWLIRLREEIKKDTLVKIENAKNEG